MKTNIAILIMAGFGSSIAAAQIGVPIGDDRSAIADLAVRNAVGTSSLILTWSTPYDWDRIPPDHYEGRYSQVDPGPSVGQTWWDSGEIISGLPVPASSGGTQQTCLVDGLLSDQTYYFALRAVDALTGPGSFSNPASGHTSADDIAPGMPTSVQVTATGPFSMNVSWINSGDDGAIGVAARILICYSTDANVGAPGWIAASTHHDVNFANAASLAQAEPISGLATESTYYIRLIAYDDVNLSSPATPAQSAATWAVTIDVGTDGNNSRCSAGAGSFALVAVLAVYAIAASKASI